MPIPTAVSPRSAPPHWTLHNFHVDVKMFGAVGDGTTDDTAAIQSAINTGGRIFVPPGNYLVGALTTSQPIDLIGAGWGSILKAKNSLNDYILTFVPGGSGIFGARISDLKFDGNNTNQTAGGCIYAKGSVQGFFQRLWITKPYAIGLYLHEISGGVLGHHNRVAYSLFDGGSASAGDGKGLQMQSSDENTVIGCDFESMGGSGSEPYAIKDWAGLNLMQSCVFVTGKEAVRIQDASNSTISGCYFDGPARDCVHTTGTYNTVSGNQFTGNCGSASAGTYSHVLLDANENTVNNNMFRTPSTNGQLKSSVREMAGKDKTLVVGNQFSITGSGTYGTSAREIVGGSSVVANNIG